MKHILSIILLCCTAWLNAEAQVFTPNGVQVPPVALTVYDNLSPNTNAELQALQNAVQNGVYGASCLVIGNYSRQYNCHGYAWHVSTGGNQVVILSAPGGVTPYVAGVNPSYKQTNYNSASGKLRVRYTGDHSAVTTYDGMYISKWGAGPMVKHSALDVPPGYGNPSTCWTCNYTPPLTSVYLDGKLISASFQNTAWGSHNMQIFWGLDPDTGPAFSPTAGSTIINNQSSGTVNFTFNGPSNNGGLSIAFCGAPRHSFTFFKPSGAKMQIHPNPVQDHGVVTISTAEENIHAVNLDYQANKMVSLRLLNERQQILQEYLPNGQDSATTIRFEPGLKGTFFLRATFEDGSVQTKRIVIGK